MIHDDMHVRCQLWIFSGCAFRCCCNSGFNLNTKRHCITVWMRYSTKPVYICCVNVRTHNFQKNVRKFLFFFSFIFIIVIRFIYLPRFVFFFSFFHSSLLLVFYIHTHIIFGEHISRNRRDAFNFFSTLLLMAWDLYMNACHSFCSLSLRLKYVVNGWMKLRVLLFCLVKQKVEVFFLIFCISPIQIHTHSYIFNTNYLSNELCMWSLWFKKTKMCIQ